MSASPGRCTFRGGRYPNAAHAAHVALHMLPMLPWVMWPCGACGQVCSVHKGGTPRFEQAYVQRGHSELAELYALRQRAHSNSRWTAAMAACTECSHSHDSLWQPLISQPGHSAGHPALLLCRQRQPCSKQRFVHAHYLCKMQEAEWGQFIIKSVTCGLHAVRAPLSWQVMFSELSWVRLAGRGCGLALRSPALPYASCEALLGFTPRFRC